MKDFKMVYIKHICREQNIEANDLAQDTSGYKPMLRDIEIEIVAIQPDDWRYEIFEYLKNFSIGVKELKYKALKYVVLDDDLYY